MALDPSTSLPTQTATPDANYPYGGAQNVTSPGDGTGTPWNADVINDIWGFLQALLEQGGVTPSGVPDTAVVSQYVEGMNNVIGSRVNWTMSSLVGSGLSIVGADEPSLAALNGTDVAFFDDANDELRTYRFNYWIGKGPHSPAGNGWT